jgi:anaerobic magnesium-protoporphyrin IX monomethyl ester cyclase
MRYQKVLLVNLAYRSSFFAEPKIPAGLGYIAEALETQGIEYQVLDMNLGYDKSHLMERIQEFKPDLLGITLMTFRYKDSYSTIADLKKEFPGMDIVAGGPHISLFRTTVLDECAAIDYGVVLEGEKTLIELCSGTDPSAIQGLIFRSGGTSVFNGERTFTDDLDAIAPPKYLKFELDKYPYPGSPNATKDIPIVSSRGCPFKCIYCPVISAIGSRFRYRSAGSIVREIQYWHNLGYRRFWFTDDNFTLVEKRVYEICDALSASAMKDLVLGCGNGLRADKVDRRLLERMREAGFRHIAFGVEAGNNRILATLKKGETIEQIENAIADATQLGFSVSLFFLIGSPGETRADVEQSFALALRYPVEDARFYHIIPYPKTELYEWIEKNRYFIHDPAQYLSDQTSLMNEPVFQTPELPADARKELFSAGQAIERQIHFNFCRNKFKALGVPAPLTGICAKIYNTRILNGIVTKTPFGEKLKEWIKSHFITNR